MDENKKVIPEDLPPIEVHYATFGERIREIRRERGLTQSEFARILGILLDNAIEAAEKSKEKLINISFRKDERNNRNLILIENSYANKDVDTEEIFNKGFTEKENHTGIGLWEVRKILSKNNNINLFTSKTDDLFKQQLEIYLN